MSHDDETMTMSRFHVLIEAYGASPARWPNEERGAAQAFLAQHEEARALVDEEAWLDRLLDSLPQAVPSATLKAALQRQASALRAGGSLSRLLKALWPEAPSAWPAGVLAASTALGIAIGIALPALGLTSQELTAGDLVSYAFSALDASEWL